MITLNFAIGSHYDHTARDRQQTPIYIEIYFNIYGIFWFNLEIYYTLFI